MSQRSFKRAHARRVAKERRRAAVLKRAGGALIGVLGASTVFAASAQAATFTVTTSNDGPVVACAGLICPTLRDAVAAANADTSPSTITFASGVTGTITLTNNVITISGTHGLTIIGPGAGTLAVSGNAASQIFAITTPNSASVAISGLTLTDGSVNTVSPGGAIEVVNGAPLTLTDATVSGSTTANTNGGGGIYTTGPVTLANSVISGNVASAGPGGGIRQNSGGSPVTVTASTITGNAGISGGGLAGGREDISANSQITNNQATSGVGGGIDANENLLILQGSTVSGNSSTSGGGGIEVGSPKYGATISGSTISGNTSGAGGGLLINENGFGGSPIEVENSTISGNHATNGAGVDVTQVYGSPVTIRASTISGNQGGANSFGGGVLVAGNVYGQFSLVDTTISGNAATSGAGVSLGGASSYEPLLGKNANGSTGSIRLDNSTIAGNAATSQGGGVYLSEYMAGTPTTLQSGTASLTSTIVAGNAPQDLARAATSTSGGFSGAFSLIQQPGSAPLTKQSVIVGVSPQLGALANNGGPTQTMLPSGTSPVIDQGHAPDSLTQDQRGAPRTVDTAIPNPPGGDGTDIGAVELPAASVVIPPTPFPTAGFSVSIRGTTLGGSATPLVVVDSTPVTCSVKAGTLASCVIEVRAKGKLVASGEATATKATTQLTTAVTPTAAGKSMLAHDRLGLAASATAVASAIGSPSVSGNLHLLASSSITLPLGKRSAKLSGSVLRELDELAKLITGANTVTCTAYSDKGRHDKSLTRSQAKAACKRLVHDGLKVKTKTVAKGHANPVASNKTRKGRTVNRRIVISFKF